MYKGADAVLVRVRGVVAECDGLALTGRGSSCRLRRQTRLFGLGQLVESGRLVESAQEHHQLIAAMRARDKSATRTIITSHIKHTRGLWVGRAEG